MKILEKFSEWLENTVIFEMAYSRKKAWETVSHLAGPISLHVIKLLTMPESLDRSHWKKEISNWLFEIQQIILKPQNKRLTFENYLEWLVKEPEYNANMAIEQLKQHYQSEKIVVSPSLQEDFLTVMKIICHNLANNQIIYLDSILG